VIPAVSVVQSSTAFRLSRSIAVLVSAHTLKKNLSLVGQRLLPARRINHGCENNT
jgi:hypothetical protein